MKPSSLREAISNATSTLREAGVSSPDVDARLLAAHLLGLRPVELMFAEPPAGFECDYAQLVARRAAREPLQHITGSAPFYGVELAVGPGVFIPRPETEVLAQWAVQMLDDAPSAPTVVDLGSGSGALAIAVARAVPAATVYAVERSHEAREYLRRNVEEHAPQVRIVAGDMTDPHLVAELAGSVDLVVSNPPYVPESPELQVEVYADPHEAVFSGTDGMAAIRGLVPVAQRLLRDGGALGIEHDDTTSVQVQDVVAAGGFGDIRVVKDLAGRARFVTARKLAR
ncbi:peptide chain release factor N(5)-glutamine methyltransferase [Corynebacterium ureicelerivorans]|uniref:Release factor glutamine methyltransferase n=1 Tax=Corynebacterium ureicelerivorans TaxID=401472 RepID=A0A077HQ07_9CORY|nr:peptide chain release factor N(5)-glutamine methyltransferase [Corynebacterium ureicelerivorans]AIL96737.1 SAM-dependent methyltransferase [Corynebacterium ureicelerivorans]